MRAETTWLDPSSGLVHGVEAADIVPIGGGHARGLLRTACGLKPTYAELAGDGEVTCALCRDAQWLEELMEGFTPPAKTVEPKKVAA